MAPLFLRLISRKSPPFLVVYFVLIYSKAESAVSPAEKNCCFGFDMAKSVNSKLSGDEFFMISISKIMVPL